MANLVACRHECEWFKLVLHNYWRGRWDGTVPLLYANLPVHYAHTIRNDSSRARRKGYIFEPRNQPSRSHIHTILTSAPERQGRPLNWLHRREVHAKDEPELVDLWKHGWPIVDYARRFPCQHHNYRMYAVAKEGVDVAVLEVMRSDKKAFVAFAMGDTEFLEDGIMALLFKGTMDDLATQNVEQFAYCWADSLEKPLGVFLRKLRITNAA